MRTVVTDGAVLDTTTMEYRGERAVVIEDGRIVDLPDRYDGDADVRIDAAGRFVLPGLVDAHVHFRLVTLNFAMLASMTEVEFGIRMAVLARQTVERGFTTVRDLGGDVVGLMSAVRRGVATGPHIVRAGRMLSQTGGHGDAEGGPREVPSCACTMRSTAFGIVADGVDAVQKAARHNLREGSDFLKVHASGGVATPSDPLGSIQYTPDELAAAVTEAEHRGTYVAAHAYTPDAITQAVRAGIHSIEHGNLIDAPTAVLMAESGTVLVPTLVTYHAMDELGERLGLPEHNRRKNSVVFGAGLASLELARDAGVTMGFGTDLIGESQTMQAHELRLRHEVEPAADVLRSMWIVNAGLCRMAGEVGVLAPGARGDVVVSRVDPLADLNGFADTMSSLTHVIRDGVLAAER